jgi:hypothetical protein
VEIEQLGTQYKIRTYERQQYLPNEILLQTQTVDISSNGVITTDLHIVEQLQHLVHRWMPQITDLEIITIQVHSLLEVMTGVVFRMITFGVLQLE